MPPAPSARPAYPPFNLFATVPPHSLTPFAMGLLTGSGTGADSQQTFAIRLRSPNIKWPAMIALSGALLGGVVGLGLATPRHAPPSAAVAPRAAVVELVALDDSMAAVAPAEETPALPVVDAPLTEVAKRPRRAPKHAASAKTAKPATEKTSAPAAKAPPKKVDNESTTDVRKVLDDAAKGTANTL